jgi:hypothetical protein
MEAPMNIELTPLARPPIASGITIGSREKRMTPPIASQAPRALCQQIVTACFWKAATRASQNRANGEWRRGEVLSLSPRGKGATAIRRTQSPCRSPGGERGRHVP